MNSQDRLKNCQSILKDAGLYQGKIDGIPGRLTREAFQKLCDLALEELSRKQVEEPKEEPPVAGEVDARSQSVIDTLLPEVQPIAKKFILECAAQDISIKIISGTRTYEEQNALYEQGRSKPGKVVTNARAGHSNHNFGIAFDIGVFKDGKYIEESPLYAAAAVIGKRLGLSWGGDWKNIEDQPHYELHPSWARDISESDMLAELRDRREANQPIFT